MHCRENSKGHCIHLSIATSLPSTICSIRPDTADLWLQVGASNELPESEELDALYDRFLIRRQVSQVSDFGLPAMLAAAADNSLAVRPALLSFCKF